MRTGERISKYRERLDETLSSPDLKNKVTLKALIRDHLRHSSLEKREGIGNYRYVKLALRGCLLFVLSRPLDWFGAEICSEDLVERRTTEVSNFLDMLRTPSMDGHGPKSSHASHGEWKVCDTYFEPFHG